MRLELRTAAAAVSAVALATPVVAYSQSETAQAAVVSGQVVDSAGCPIIGAAMSLRLPWSPYLLRQTQSDSQGMFTFAPIESRRDYWIDSVWAGGAGGSPVRLSPDGSYIVVRPPWPRPTDIVAFAFRITDLDDEPVRDARVTWHRIVGPGESDCVNGTITTDAGGRAVAAAVPPGQYRVSVEATGFAPYSIDTTHDSSNRPLVARLHTVEEARKARKPTAEIISDGPAPPSSIAALVVHAEAIVVARVVRASLETEYGPSGDVASVRTEYDIQLLEIIKGSPLLNAGAGIVSITHGAGELELDDMIVLGGERTAATVGDVYVMFLVWNEYRRMFTPAHINTFLANITSGVVMPMRRTRKVSPIIASRKGTPAAKFLQDLRAAVTAYVALGKP